MHAEGLENLLVLLESNQLLDAHQLQQISEGTREPARLVEELVQRGWLTQFQAQHILAGEVASLSVGSYLLLEAIGKGGMGMVYKARHRTLERLAAVKFIRKESLDNPRAVKRFYQEARAAARLDHPNIVKVFDAGPVNDAHYMAMEYVAGQDLAQLLKKCGRLQPGQACDYIRQAAVGLQHAHEKGLVHRDLKPANLIVTQAQGPQPLGLAGVLKILDMGLARVEFDRATPLTHHGMVMGTPDYMAPEQALDAHEVDIRADLYSLGCTLYELLTGRVPFPGGNFFQKLEKHRTAQARPVQDGRPTLPPAVVRVVERLMAKAPADRFQTPIELAEVLEPLCALEEKAETAQPATVDAPASAKEPGPTRVTQAGDTPRPPDASVAAIAAALTAGNEGAGQRLGRPRDRRRGVRWVILTLLLASSTAVVAWTGLFGSGRTTEPNPGSPTLAPTETRPPLSSRKGEHSSARTTATEAAPQPIVAELLPLPVEFGEILHVPGEDPLQDAVFCSDGKRLIGFCQGKNYLYYYNDLAKPGPPSKYGDHSEFIVKCLAFSSPSEARAPWVLFGAPNPFVSEGAIGKAIWHWKLTPGSQPSAKPLPSRDGVGEALTTVAFFPNGDRALAGTDKGGLRVWSIDRAKDVLTEEKAWEKRHEGWVKTAAFTSDGKVAVTGDRNEMIYLWNVAEGKMIRSCTFHKRNSAAYVTRALFRPQAESQVLSSDYSGRLLLWEHGENVSLVKEFKDGHKGAILCLAFSSDGQRFLSGGVDGRVLLWNVATGAVERPLDGHHGAIRAVAFSQDGRHALSASADNTIRRWLLHE